MRAAERRFESAPRRSLGAALLLLLGTFLGFVLLEVGARVILARRPVVTTGEQTIYTQSDPILGWRNRPGSSVRYQRREYSTSVAINALGFRDIERTATRPPGVGRVLAIGDSFIEAYSVERDESMTRRAEATANGEGCAVEFVNAGVHAYSTDQEALWYQNEGAALGADVVLLFVYYNDILNNIRSNYWGSAKPLTAIVDGRIVATNAPLPMPVEKPGSARIEVSKRPGVTGSAFKGLLGERLQMGAPRLFARLTDWGVFAPSAPEDFPDELRAFKLRGQLAEFDEAWQRTEALLSVLSRLVKERGGRPVLVHIPARFEVSERDWDLTQKRHGLDPAVWDRTLVARRLQRIAAAHEWSFLDLTAALRDSIRTFGPEPYFLYDGHWNRFGNDVAARGVVDFLRQGRLLPCGGGLTPASAQN